MKVVSFIGAGNMASAIVNGIVTSGLLPAESILLCARYEESFRKFPHPGIRTTNDIGTAVDASDVIVFSVKPQSMKEVLPQVASQAPAGKVFISIAAGVPIATFEACLGQVPIVRVMPNTPMLIGMGVSALCRNAYVSDENFAFAKSLFSASGMAVEMKEDEINRITAATGSSPAYVYLFIKAIRDSMLKMGIDHPELTEMICRTVIGSANMILSDSRSIDELIRMVTSPGGTTERALSVMAQKDLCGIVDKAMTACVDRAEELAKMN